MKTPIVLNRIKHQSGFTLIEMLVAGLIALIIAAAAISASSQIMQNSALSNGNMNAMNEINNADLWISQDARMADSITLTPLGGSDPSLVKEIYIDSSKSTQQTFDYKLSNGDLSRTYNGGAPVVISTHIDSISAVLNDTILTLTIKSTVGSGVQQQKTFQIDLRNK